KARLDGMLGVPSLLVEVEDIRLVRRNQHLLRKRRPLVRTVLLLADQEDAAGEPGLAHCEGSPGSGLTGADDNVRFDHEMTRGRNPACSDLTSMAVRRNFNPALPLCRDMRREPA